MGLTVAEGRQATGAFPLYQGRQGFLKRALWSRWLDHCSALAGRSSSRVTAVRMVQSGFPISQVII